MRPLPPRELLEHIGCGAGPESFAATFPHVRDEVTRYLGRAGLELSRFREILDFGCGPGRFLLALEPALASGQRLTGCDVCRECVDWCRDNVDFARVEQNGIEPPLPFAAGRFDLVYALSVFTHLRLDLQFRWARELYRVLQPGGVLFASLHGPGFFEVFVEEFRRKAAGRVEIATVSDDGLFCYLDVRGRAEDQGQTRVAAAHSPGLAEHVFAPLERVARFPQSLMAGGQDVYVWRKPASARPVVQPAAAGPVRSPLGRGRQPEPATLVLVLDGQRTFRVYPSVSPPGVYSVSALVEVRSAGGRTLASREVALNGNRVFGGSHRGFVQTEVAEHAGPAVVRLLAFVTDWGTMPDDASAEVAWDFPCFS